MLFWGRKPENVKEDNSNSVSGFRKPEKPGAVLFVVPLYGSTDAVMDLFGFSVSAGAKRINHGAKTNADL